MAKPSNKQPTGFQIEDYSDAPNINLDTTSNATTSTYITDDQLDQLILSMFKDGHTLEEVLRSDKLLTRYSNQLEIPADSIKSLSKDRYDQQYNAFLDKIQQAPGPNIGSLNADIGNIDTANNILTETNYKFLNQNPDTVRILEYLHDNDLTIDDLSNDETLKAFAESLGVSTEELLFDTDWSSVKQYYNVYPEDSERKENEHELSIANDINAMGNIVNITPNELAQMSPEQQQAYFENVAKKEELEKEAAEKKKAEQEAAKETSGINAMGNIVNITPNELAQMSPEQQQAYFENVAKKEELEKEAAEKKKAEQEAAEKEAAEKERLLTDPEYAMQALAKYMYENGITPEDYYNMDFNEQDAVLEKAGVLGNTNIKPWRDIDSYYLEQDPNYTGYLVSELNAKNSFRYINPETGELVRTNFGTHGYKYDNWFNGLDQTDLENTIMYLFHVPEMERTNEGLGKYLTAKTGKNYSDNAISKILKDGLKFMEDEGINLSYVGNSKYYVMDKKGNIPSSTQYMQTYMSGGFDWSPKDSDDSKDQGGSGGGKDNNSDLTFDQIDDSNLGGGQGSGSQGGGQGSGSQGGGQGSGSQGGGQGSGSQGGGQGSNVGSSAIPDDATLEEIETGGITPNEAAYNSYWNSLFSMEPNTLGNQMYNNFANIERNAAVSNMQLAEAQYQQAALQQAEVVKNITDQVKAERMARLRSGMNEAQIANQDMQIMLNNMNALNNQANVMNQNRLAAQQQYSLAQDTAYQQYLDTAAGLSQTAAAHAAADDADAYLQTIKRMAQTGENFATANAYVTGSLNSDGSVKSSNKYTA